MNDETILDGGTPAVEPVPEEAFETTETLAETPEQIAEKAKAEEEHKRKTGSQRAREKAERLERENQALRDALARGQKAPEQEATAKPPSADGRPDPDDPKFKSYEDYLDALTDWKVENRLKLAEEKKAEQAEAETLRTKAASAHEAHPDLAGLLDELDDMGIAPTETMHRAIHAAESGGELLYHLAKNPAEVKRIGALPPVVQAMELGVMLGQLKAAETKSETKSETKPEPKPTQAPVPPKPIKGPATPPVDESKLSDADWLKAKTRR